MAGPRDAVPASLRWGVPAAAIAAVVLVVLFRGAVKDAVPPPPPDATPGAPGSMGITDITSMSPAERADRLFNRVMEYSSAGKSDSAAFFAPMAMAAFEALVPLNAHSRYDLGLVALVAGDNVKAGAQADSILAERSTHLLGLSLAARAADARGDAAAARAARQKMLAAEQAERAAGLPEYTDHAADLTAAIEGARSR
ncbi:MAG: hypothetical protein ACSLFK_09365 [Gemmatimonadaceae bacterium]